MNDFVASCIFIIIGVNKDNIFIIFFIFLEVVSIIWLLRSRSIFAQYCCTVIVDFVSNTNPVFLKIKNCNKSTQKWLSKDVTITSIVSVVCRLLKYVWLDKYFTSHKNGPFVESVGNNIVKIIDFENQIVQRIVRTRLICIN